jgi:hypothetical protein
MGTYAPRSLQGPAGAGYDDSSVSDITHSVGAITVGAWNLLGEWQAKGIPAPSLVARIAVWGVVEDE